MTSYRYGYARVSTSDQDPALQVDALQATGVDPGQVFVDVASGALAIRPQLEQLRGRLRPGDTLVVWRLDRLGRSLTHLVGLITELGEQQIGFVSLTEAIDTTTPAGRLLFGVMASLAQFERDVIRERTIAGLAAAKARGRVGGRPAIMTPDKLAVARQLLAEGKSKAAVAKTIGVSDPRCSPILLIHKQHPYPDTVPGERVPHQLPGHRRDCLIQIFDDLEHLRSDADTISV